MSPAKSQVLNVCAAIAAAAERAANATIDSMGYEHIPELRAIIRRNECEHRAFGARVFGRRSKQGLTMRETESLFIAKCLASAAIRHPLGGCTLSEVQGVRDDYLLAARMWDIPAFRHMLTGLLANDDRLCGTGASWAHWVGEHADYARFQP